MVVKKVSIAFTYFTILTRNPPHMFLRLLIVWDDSPFCSVIIGFSLKLIIDSIATIYSKIVPYEEINETQKRNNEFIMPSNSADLIGSKFRV